MAGATSSWTEICWCLPLPPRGTVPDVVVEILSPGGSDRDEHLKRRLYERHGIPEYWVVDPEIGYVTVWRLDSGCYGLRVKLDRSSTLEHPDFPGLQVPLLEIFS